MTTEVLVPAPNQYGRMAIMLVAFVLLFGVLVHRLHHLQVAESAVLTARAEAIGRARLEIPAARGSIVDAHGEPLARVVPSWHLFADAGYMDDKLKATVYLSRILDLSRDELRRRLDSNGNGLRIARHISDEQAAAIEALGIDHMYLRRAYERQYPLATSAALVTGFLNAEEHGGGGLELVLDQHLRGQPGHKPIRRDARNRIVIDRHGDRIDARPGAHVQVTIESDLQQLLHDRLSTALEHHQARGAYGVMIRPTTGEIVALASLPCFDPHQAAEDFARDPDLFRNGVVQFAYESGSTIKPLIAGAVVSDGLFDWETRIDCERGRWTARVGRSPRVITSSHPYGLLSVAEGVAKSDNILMAKMVLRMPAERLHDWVAHAGFGAVTGIDLPGEEPGRLTTRNRWTQLHTAVSVAMGYEILVTPLQMALAHGAIANRGVWMPPRLINRIYTIDSESGRQVDLPVPAAPRRRQLFKADEALRVQAVMARTMTEGTGRRAQLTGYTSAGKTGTTRKFVDGAYSSSHHIGSFVAWAPADPDREPELLCLVVIDEPQANGYYGSQTAAPVVQQVLQEGLERLGVPQRGGGDD